MMVVYALYGVAALIVLAPVVIALGAAPRATAVVYGASLMITLTLGVDDVLLLRNLDEVPQQFGPTILMPGQSFRLPFERESENQFDCTAHTSGTMTVIVEAAPSRPWQKIRWRWRHWVLEGNR